MNHPKQPSPLISHSLELQPSQFDESHLWQEYSHQLTSIAATLSDSYWLSQGLSMLKLQTNQPLQSKTKDALKLLNCHNSKIELINKILKNLTLCSTIQTNQEKLVKQVITITNQWENWKRLKVSKLHFQDGIFGNNHVGFHQNEPFPENIDTFETEFDDRRLKEFVSSQNHEEKDIQI